MVDSNETIMYENGRDTGYAEGYEDGQRSRVNFKFEEEDFETDELMLLRMAFRLVDTAIETQREGNYDVYLSNELFNLKEKLGIGDLID